MGEEILEGRFLLNEGAQVREENFGLLFYTMAGPRLYFLSSGGLLDISFFDGALTLSQWIKETEESGNAPENRIEEIVKSLGRLKDKGVIVER